MAPVHNEKQHENLHNMEPNLNGVQMGKLHFSKPKKFATLLGGGDCWKSDEIDRNIILLVGIKGVDWASGRGAIVNLTITTILGKISNLTSIFFRWVGSTTNQLSLECLKTCFFFGWGLPNLPQCQEVVYFFAVPEKFKRWRWHWWFVVFSRFFSLRIENNLYPKNRANILGKRCCKHVEDISYLFTVYVLHVLHHIEIFI